LAVFGCWVVDDQRDCSDIDASADGLSAQEDLYFLISELLYSLGFGASAVLRTVVCSFTQATPCMDVVNGEIMFSFGVGLRIIDDKGIFLLLQWLVEVPKLFSFVEKDDDLQFVLELTEFL
jgi:hypothetical protein